MPRPPAPRSQRSFSGAFAAADRGTGPASSASLAAAKEEPGGVMESVAQRAAPGCRPSLRVMGAVACIAWAAGSLLGLALVVRDLNTVALFVRSLTPCHAAAARPRSGRQLE